ncbi:hypothetical protein CKA38_14900 [Ereboglobus luteus]|uniref:TonB C-terminal domain-containing protein n=1 Tax=Ereboglobus luteus TaxID=1796921 RepID=A0A2U8E676_9BACT|nr:hypothetical protein CKA38_14900 [Ereboglobus luteus]
MGVCAGPRRREADSDGNGRAFVFQTVGNRNGRPAAPERINALPLEEDTAKDCFTAGGNDLSGVAGIAHHKRHSLRRPNDRRRGNVSRVRVLDSTHPDFVRRSEAKFKEWKFEPAKQGDLALPGKTRASLEFSAWGERQKNETDTDVFTMAPPEGVSIDSYCEKEPERVIMVDPVFPYELATTGKSGEAVVRFTVSDTNKIRDIEVLSASDPECGRSLVAALEGSYIKAGTKTLKPASLRMTWRHVFKQPPAEPVINANGEIAESSEMRMIRHLANGNEVLGARGLDGRPRPVWRAAPVPPRAFAGKEVKGETTIEFIIDREGRACLPRIVQASHPEFGWAAVTALNQWVFDPLTRGGQPTEARVRVPFSF